MTRVALVVLDTLRKDAFDEHFDWLPGERFENAWSPSHWTVPVHGSLFTGKYPTEHGSIASSKTLSTRAATLPETLQAEGFTTRGSSANPFITPAYRFDRGFETFGAPFDNLPMFNEIFDWGAFHGEYGDEGVRRFGRAVLQCIKEDVDTTRSLEVGIRIKLRELLGRESEDSGITKATRWFDKQDLSNDEFVFFNLMEAHAPYDQVPPEYVAGSSPLELGLQHHFDPPEHPAIRDAYDGAVSYLSDAYETLFEQLIDQMDYVITLGDHGELLGEHEHYGHEYGLYPELTHVPLVVSGEHIESSSENALVSLLDVYPTVLDIADVPADTRGDSLLNERTGSSYLVEGHGLPENRVQKLSNMGHDVSEYDSMFRGLTTTEGYEYETAAGWESEGTTGSEKLREQLDKTVQTLEKAPKTNDRPELSEGALDRLKANGYA